MAKSKILYIKPGNHNEVLHITKQEDIFLIGNEGGEYALEVVLEAEGASANIYGVLIGLGANEFNLSTISRHISPNTSSRVHIKGVFDDKSKLNYKGLIRIEPDAQLSDAYLKNDNLLLSSDAVVDSSPQLEILANDVKASHGVTISTFDDMHRYYLKSRGLNLDQVDDILVSGFVNDILLKLDTPISALKLLKSHQYVK